MSRAFTRDGQEGEGAGVLPDRPVSSERNLVTRRGLGLIEAAIAAARADLASAEAGGDRLAMANAARDLRYWQARRATAEPVDPPEGSEAIRFGMTARLRYEDGHEATWQIVGEDEADAAHGQISHASALARALFGKSVGDEVSIRGTAAEITAIGAAP